MTKYTKFTLTPYGELVYKNTGQFVLKQYEIRGNRVYYKGRLKGYISKATKKDVERQIKAEKNREKYRAKIRKELKNVPSQTPDLTDVHDIAEMTNILDMSHPISNEQKQLFNFVTHLYDMVDSGYISMDTANAYLNEYRKARTPEEKTKIWNKLKALQKDVGYEGSPL